MNESLIFEGALKRATPAERAAYLDGACAGNPPLRKQVEDLLRAGDQNGDFMEKPVGNLEATVDVPPGKWIDPATLNQPADKTGTLIGPYKLLQKIGEGGMGTVWMAEQQEPVRRMVAVKLVKAGMDSDKVVARFEAERQALALMDHPNIARIYDAGIQGNRPFFVMELVKGTPITQYCDDHRLSPDQRLELFVAVCAAIQHAHQKGIIHRDIKPSNVLVAPYDGRPVVKVIDFGVAKATGQRLTDKTMYTEFGAIVGTLEYMSPEQAELNNQDIDTRSDIYALGVLLYELLTGSTPLNRKSLKVQAMLEMLRIVREVEPPRPSTRLSTDDALASISAQRHMDPTKLTKLMKGELDWIVMKSLEKDRNRRYETANGFGMDIQRYLGGEAVLAHPPNTLYRFKKFVRRNKGQVIAASLVFFALLAGMGGTTWGLIRAERSAEAERVAKLDSDEKKVLAEQAAAAERVAKVAAQEANDLTAGRLKQIELINNSVFDIFAEFDISKVKAGNEPVEAVLAKKLVEAGRKLDEKAIHDPLVLAGLRNRLGRTLLNLGETEAAIGLFEKARETRTAKLGADHPNTLDSMNNLASGYLAAGKLDRALPLYEETLKLRTAKLGADHPDTLTSMNNLAVGYQAAGKLDKALSLYEETLKLQKAKLGADHPHTLTNINNLASGYKAAGKLDKALPLYEETLKLRTAKLGADHPDTLFSMNHLASGYQAAGRLDKALPLWEETLKLRTAKLGADHPLTLTSMNNLANGYYTAGKLDKALPLYEETLKLMTAKLGADHPYTLTSMNNLLKAYGDAGETTKAVALLGEVRKRLAKDSPQLAGGLAQLGLSLLKAKAFTEAEPLLRECLAIREKTPGADAPGSPWQLFNTQSMLGGALLGQKKYAEAEPLLLKGYEGMKERQKAIPKAGATRIPEALDRLIGLYTATEKPDEAAKWRAERAKYPAEELPMPKELK